MRKTFQMRLFPSKRQEKLLRQTLGECLWLYNQLLEDRKRQFEENQSSLTLYDQHSQTTQYKKERQSLKQVHSQVLQNVAVRIDLAFKAFFRRVKQNNGKAGFPRFKAFFRYDSFTYPQSGFSLDGHHLQLSKIGNLHIKVHRQIEGDIKTLTLKRSATGKWYASFSCEVTAKPLPESVEAIALDVGLESFSHLSNDERIENPRFFRQEEKRLAKAQRHLSKQEKGTPQRARRRKVVSRLHERIKFKRTDFIHQESRKMVNRFGFIFVEDLNVNRMMHNHCLAKSIADAAWSGFFGQLSSKAAEAGRVFVKVNPAYSSQDCSRCGHRQKLALSSRIYRCPCCHLEIHRDLNSSLNLLAVGLYSIGNQSIEAASFQGAE
jgi:putative transposase